MWTKWKIFFSSDSIGFTNLCMSNGKNFTGMNGNQALDSEAKERTRVTQSWSYLDISSKKFQCQ